MKVGMRQEGANDMTIDSDIHKIHLIDSVMTYNIMSRPIYVQFR